MKNIQWAVNGILFLAVAVLYALHFSGGSDGSAPSNPKIEQTTAKTEDREDEETTNEAGEQEIAAVSDSQGEEKQPSDEDENPVYDPSDDKGIPQNSFTQGIAFVDIRKLDEEYHFIVNSREKLGKKGKQLEKTLGEWQQRLQKEALDAQKKLQAGQLNQEQAMKLNNDLMGQQQEYMEYEQRETDKLLKERNALNVKMLEKISGYMKSYAKKKDIRLVLGYDGAGGGGIIYADPALDVTAPVLIGLNK